MLVAHIDASGNMGQAPVFVMAGYVASVASWEAFSREWQEVLDRPKAVGVFKMSHAMAREGRFEGWSIEDRDARLKMLAQTINRHALVSVNTVVPIESWRKHFVGQLENSYHNRPYFFSVHNVMSTLIRYLHFKNIDEKIDFIFDSEDGEPTAQIQEGFDAFKKVGPPHLQQYFGGLTPIFAKEEDMLPIQAADMMAWHVRRAYYEGLRGIENPITSVVSEELFEGRERVECVWKDSELEAAVKFIQTRRWRRVTGTSMTIPDPSNWSKF